MSPAAGTSALHLRSRSVESGEVTSLLESGLRERVTRLHARSAPVVIGIAGSVAVGKSTFAAALVEGLKEFQVEVVGTDGFLYPNAVLAERQIESRKGFPESYDANAVVAFIDALRRFTSRHSIPQGLYPDNASTFVSASNILIQFFKQPEVASKLANMRITWKFIPKRALCYGGWWESG